jgi:para-nitrobenzyl esterase
VRGAHAGATYVFKGVPYAAPPTGDLRFAPPRPAPCFKDTRDATSFASACVQVSPSGKKIGGDEDCLYLNVWSPDAAVTEALPVIVFFHGGFFVEGSAEEQYKSGAAKYDGAYLAEHARAVVVTVDYRLGALGFLAAGGAANFGLRDQIAALEWVKTNIAGFGGDAARVTIFGQGSGGTCVSALLASPRANGLFARAIIDSGDASARSLADAQTVANDLAQKLGCAAEDAAACLRTKDAVAIATTEPSTSWGPVIDGDSLPKAPEAVFAATGGARVPIIVGTNADDESTLVAMHFSDLPIDSDAQYQKAARAWLAASVAPANVDAIVERYSSAGLTPKYASPELGLVAMVTDRDQTCAWRRRLRAMSGARAFRYLYAHTDSSGFDKQYGAGHTMELKLIWRSFGTPGFAPSAGELALSDALIGYIGRFAKSGDPNGGAAAAEIAWPPYDAKTDPYLRIGDAVSAAGGARTEECDLWDGWSKPSP